MSAFAAAAADEDHDAFKALQATCTDLRTAMIRWAERAEKAEAERDQLTAAVTRLHAAKGRYHTQLAAADLFELCGLTAERPKK